MIRGSDHRPNEAVQRRIARALGGELPEVIHHGLLLGDDGKKLSKRHGHASVADLRDDGNPRGGAARVPRRARPSRARRAPRPGAASGGSRSRRSRRCRDEELAAAAGAPAERRPRAPRRADARRGAGDRPADRRTPTPVALPAEARPTLERFVELRERSAGHAGRGRRPRDRPRAEGRRRRPRALRLALDRASARAGALDGRRGAAARRGARARAPGAAAELNAERRRGLRSRDASARHADRRARRAPAAARADRDLRLRPDRLPARAHRQRAAVRRLHVARAVARASGATRCGSSTTSPTSTTRSTRPRPGRSAERARRGDRVVPRGHRGLRARDARRAAARDRDDAGDHRADRGAARERTRVRGRRRRLLPRRALRDATARCPASGPIRSRSRSRIRRRRIRATSRSGRRRRRGRTRRGRRRGASVARAGTSSAPRWRRRSSGRSSGSTAAGSTSSSRTTRTSARNRSSVGHPFARIWMHNGMLRFTGEKMSKSVGNVETIRDVLDGWGRGDGARVLPHGALAQADRLLRRDDGRGAAQAETLRNALRGETRGRRASGTRSSSALEDDFNTPAALAILHDWARAGRARRAAARRSTCSGSRALGAMSHRAADVVALAEARATARARRDFAEADRLRDEIVGAGWEVRDARAPGYELVRRARDPRPRLRAERRSGRRCAGGGACSRCGSGSAPRRRSSGSPRGRGRACERERELTEAAGSPDHQGVVAWCEPYPYADAWELASVERAAPLLPRPGHRPSEPRRRRRSAAGAGATGVVLPAHGAARRHRRPCAVRRPAPSSTSRSRSSRTSPATSAR